MRLPHVTPFARFPIYFFTICTARREPLLANANAAQCLESLWRNSAHSDGWVVGRYVVMPDHVHFFAKPAPESQTRATWLKMIKSVSARRLAKTAAVEPPIWQPDTFDHILRSAESYAEKWEYVRLNPVRKGYVAQPEDWPWQGEINQLTF